MNNAGALEVTTPSDREIVVTRLFDAPRQLVFDCHTKPELVRRWLLGPPGWTMPVCEIDPKVGGAIRYVWRRDADGTDMGLSGVVREIVPPRRLVVTELFDQDWTGGETLVTSVFTEKAGKTTLTMTVLYSSRAARDGALGTGMMRGMEQSYQRLDAMLAAGIGSSRLA